MAEAAEFTCLTENVVSVEPTIELNVFAKLRTPAPLSVIDILLRVPAAISASNSALT